MVPVPTSYLNVPVFGASATNIQPGGTVYNQGFLPGQLFPAEYENWLMNRLTTNSLASQTTNLSVAAEIVNILNQASIVPDPASTTQLYAALNALYATVGGLSTESSARASADTTLQSNINAEATARANADALLAPLLSPALTGSPVAPTPSPGDNSTRVATSAFVTDALAAASSALVIKSLTHQEFNSVTGAQTLSAMAVGEMRFVFITAGSSATLKTPTASGSFLCMAQVNGVNTGSNPVANNTQFVSLGSGAGYSGIVIRIS